VAADTYGFRRTHQRTHSDRVLRSTRPGSGEPSYPPLPGYIHRDPIFIRPGQSNFTSFPPPRQERPRSPLRATAFLNLSLRILRTNGYFQELLRGTEVRGRDLTEIMEVGSGITLQQVSIDLRDERTQVEPSFLPSIYEGEDQRAVDSVDENDLVRLMSEFQQRPTFECNLVLPGGERQPIQARIQLARTRVTTATDGKSSFFAVLQVLPLPPPMPYPGQRYSDPMAPPPQAPYLQQGPPSNMAYYQPGPPSPFAVSAPPSPFSNIQPLYASLPPVTAPLTAMSPYPQRQDPFRFAGSSTGGSSSAMPPPYPPSRPQSAASSGRGSFEFPLRTPATSAPMSTSYFPPQRPQQQQQTSQQPQGEPSRPLERRESAGSDEQQQGGDRKRRRLNIRDVMDPHNQ